MKHSQMTLEDNGVIIWRKDGELHREDGPAATDKEGRQKWCINGKLHRVGGPAFVNPDVLEGWYQHGRLHRVDGPAVVYSDAHGGAKFWYYDGEQIRQAKRYQELTKLTDEAMMLLVLKYGDIK